jgi:hypothetical protein
VSKNTVTIGTSYEVQVYSEVWEEWDTLWTFDTGDEGREMIKKERENSPTYLWRLIRIVTEVIE